MISQSTWNVPSKEMPLTQGCIWYRNSMVDWAAALGRSVWVCFGMEKIKRQWGEHAHAYTNALVCTARVYVKVSEGSIDMLYSEHLEQRQWGLGCCISSSVLHSDDLSQHTVTLTPPLSICWNHSFYWTAANQKRWTPLSLQQSWK